MKHLQMWLATASLVVIAAGVWTRVLQEWKWGGLRPTTPVEVVNIPYVKVGPNSNNQAGRQGTRSGASGPPLPVRIVNIPAIEVLKMPPVRGEVRLDTLGSGPLDVNISEVVGVPLVHTELGFGIGVSSTRNTVIPIHLGEVSIREDPWKINP